MQYLQALLIDIDNEYAISTGTIDIDIDNEYAISTGTIN